MDQNAAYREANVGLLPAHREGLYPPQSYLWLRAIFCQAQTRLGAHCVGIVASHRDTNAMEHGLLIIGPPGDQIGWLKNVGHLAWQIEQKAVVLKAAGENAVLFDRDGGQTDLGPSDAERLLSFYELLRPVKDAEYYSFAPSMGRPSPIITSEQVRDLIFRWISSKT